MSDASLVTKLLRLDAALAARVSAFRFDARLSSEAEAYRHLLDEGLRAEEAKAARRVARRKPPAPEPEPGQ
jgi:hypothetical protein